MVYKCLKCRKRFQIDKYHLKFNSYNNCNMVYTLCENCVDNRNSKRFFDNYYRDQKEFERNPRKFILKEEKIRKELIMGFICKFCGNSTGNNWKCANGKCPLMPKNEKASTSAPVFINHHDPGEVPTQTSDDIEEFDSSGTTVLFNGVNENVENVNPNIPDENGVDGDINDDGVDSHLADGVDEQFLTEFLDEAKDSAVYNQKMEEKRSFIKTKLDYGRRFYFESNDQLLLNHNSFLRYSGISNFDVGYAWKNKVDRMDKFQLLCQLVNEMNQIKACCLQLYYRESAISVCPSRRIKLIQKYIGKSHENEFKTKTEREVKEFVWFLKIYKRRYLNVQERVKNVLGLDVEFIKSIKTYDDVYDYFIYNCNLKEFNNNNDKM